MDEKQYESDEARYDALRKVGQEAEAPTDFDPGDEEPEFEEVTL